MTKKVNNTFKVNLDNKDILVTEEQRMRFLQLHNKLKDAVEYASECKDLRLSDLSVMEELVHHLHTSLSFSPTKNPNTDQPNIYSDYVLSSDETAWERAY